MQIMVKSWVRTVEGQNKRCNMVAIYDGDKQVYVTFSKYTFKRITGIEPSCLADNQKIYLFQTIGVPVCLDDDIHEV